MISSLISNTCSVVYSSISTSASFVYQGASWIISNTPYLIYQGVSLTAQGISNSAAFTWKAVPVVTSQVSSTVAGFFGFLSVPVAVITLTALAGLCLYGCAKSGLLKAGIKLGKNAGKATKCANKVAKRAGKAVIKHGPTLQATSKITWKAKDVLLNLAAITYISWQIATLSQQVLVGAAVGFTARIAENHFRWNAFQEQHSHEEPAEQAKMNWGMFKTTYSHDVVQFLPIFENRHLVGLGRKVLALGAAYAASESVKSSWFVHPQSPAIAGAVLGYQAGSFALNIPLDTIKTVIQFVK